MADLSEIVALRRAEIEEERARIRARLDEIDAEIADLETTTRVIARLSRLGQSVTATDREDEEARGKPEGTPTVPSMILSALQRAAEGGVHELEPSQITEWIRRNWWEDAKSSHVASIAWRMWKRGQLAKDDSRYSLLNTNEAAGASPKEASPAASASLYEELLRGVLQLPAQGREAGPGGGG